MMWTKGNMATNEKEKEMYIEREKFGATVATKNIMKKKKLRSIIDEEMSAIRTYVYTVNSH